MSLPTCNINVSSYDELFWHLLQPRGEVTKYPPPINVPDKATKSLFALLIAIEAYSWSLEYGPIGGCIKDADAVHDYLLTNLQVPQSQIRVLKNQQAKRKDIIQAIGDIEKDTRIKKGDAILIFYAGHGGETDSPPDWPSGDVNNKIQMIVPQDYSSEPGKEVHGIPDRSLAALIDKIANKHGNNITVIFDSCNSGSGTRGRLLPRGLPKKLCQPIPSDLDRGIWGPASGTHGSTTGSGSSLKGLSSHVLLAACKQTESAFGSSETGGQFTQALVPTLISTGADKLTYASLLARMDKIPNQNPQCEGVYQDRAIFDSKVPPKGRVCFPIKLQIPKGTEHGIRQDAEFGLYNDELTMADSNPLCVFVVAALADISRSTTTLTIKQLSSDAVLRKTSRVLQTKAGQGESSVNFEKRVCFPLKLEMQAGTVHGITQGAEFGLYNDSLTIADSSPLCVLVIASAADIGPFTTILKAKQPSSDVTLRKASCVVQTKAGEAEDLLFFAPLDDRLDKLYKRLAEMLTESYPSKLQIRPVLEREKTRLGLSIVGNKIAFDIFDQRLIEYGQTRMPHTVKNDPEEVIPVLHAAAHFYWHLNRDGKDALADISFIQIECHTVVSKNGSYQPTGENHIQHGVIDIVGSEETCYGYKITNTGDNSLFVNAFYFDNTDFSIAPYYQPHTSGQFDGQPTLPKRGDYLTIGYGASGASQPYYYYIEGDANIDVGYLLFFITSKNVNLSAIPQDTPFKGPGRKSGRVMRPEPAVYKTILVPIVVRRTAS